jgi:hypothetical protein
MRLAIFKDLYVACTLRRCEIAVDLIERIKSELQSNSFYFDFLCEAAGVLLNIRDQKSPP